MRVFGESQSVNSVERAGRIFRDRAVPEPERKQPVRTPAFSRRSRPGKSA